MLCKCLKFPLNSDCLCISVVSWHFLVLGSKVGREHGQWRLKNKSYYILALIRIVKKNDTSK